MDYHRRKLFDEFAPVFVFGAGMSFLLQALGIEPMQAGPVESPLTDASWWGSLGAGTAAGMAVGPETALKLSTVWACVGLLSDVVATLPLVVYRNLERDMGKERARNHPLYRVLHDQPNENQTAFEFWQMNMVHLLMRGNGFSRIVPGARGFVDQLIPEHPDDVAVDEIIGTKRLRYAVAGRPYNQEDILHLRGLSLDGKVGLSVITYARESLGMSLAAERYGGRFFGNDSKPGGVLKTDRKLTDGAAKRLKATWESAHAGANQHRVAVLEEGLEWQQIGISPEDAQFLETREFQSEDICRWFRVPPHMVGLTSKATSWGSGIEQMGMGFVTYTLMPWLRRIEQAINTKLILAPDTYFASFVVEGLLRGSLLDRYNAYSIGISSGILAPNEARHLENMNSRLGGDVYLTPLNMRPNSPTPDPSPEGRGGQAAAGHYRLLAEESAGRLVRKESAAVTRAIAKGEGWETAVSDFYASHAELVGQSLRIPLAAAVAYCEGRETAVLRDGLAAFADEAALVCELADLATGVVGDE